MPDGLRIQDGPTSRMLVCDHCGGPLRVGEQVFVIDGDYGRWAFLSRERDAPKGALFHRPCFVVVWNSGTVDWLVGMH